MEDDNVDMDMDMDTIDHNWLKRHHPRLFADAVTLSRFTLTPEEIADSLLTGSEAAPSLRARVVGTVRHCHSMQRVGRLFAKVNGG